MPTSASFPVVTIQDISKSIISNIQGKDEAIVTFSFDRDIIEWTVNIMGVSYNTGIVVDSSWGSTIPANTPIQATINWAKCFQRGDNRVNIYGKDALGNWTPYVTPPQNMYGQVIFGADFLGKPAPVAKTAPDMTRPLYGIAMYGAVSMFGKAVD
jgi:hypothetical protein